ncbi:uncharacterized protein LOC123523670 isoform X2 [Mercenaria mercenaria]|uniref:uncharacterized protein LOC123523670 isoform X2 n=1 Tax=Mercenaria mercenaria TaxID=6596 RepID=UPI00234F5B88|nr:uncharacterized protein LOC123523670 isoform X2 [Mercenaria mercenaria]
MQFSNMDWKQVLDWYSSLSGKLLEDLKSDSNVDNGFDRNNNSNENDDVGIGKTDNTSSTTGKHTPTTDGPPDDIRAFYGHPLTAATASANDADTHASAVALLHEYINLPALDRSGMKIGDKINSIYDIMRDDGSSAKVETGSEGDGDYMQMLQTTLASEVDKFFNRDCGEDTTVVIATENTNCPVSIAEEVINEVCVETSCFSAETVDPSQLYVEVPQSVVHSSENTTDASVPELPVAMRSLEDMSGDIPAQSCSANKAPAVTAVLPPEKVTCSSRRPREPKEQVNVKTQELSKKLVKALTEKIMKRMNQKDQQTISEKTELETAVSNLPPGGREGVCTNNVEDKYTYITDSAVLKDISVEKNHETILENLPVTLPVIEAESLDASPVPMTTYSSSHLTSSTAHTSSSPLSLTKEIKTAQNCTQTRLVDAPQTIESASVTRRVTVPIFNKDSAIAHAQTLETKQYVRQNSVPATNQNGYQTNSSNSAANICHASNGPPPVYYFPDVNSGAISMYQNPVRSTVAATSDCDIMLERYIQQQAPYVHENPSGRGHGKETYSLKSPDSGFCEPCVSPREPNHVQYSEGVDLKRYPDGSGDEGDKRGGKVARRRKSAPPMYVKQYWHPLDKLAKSGITKLEEDPAGYKYFLECPISTTQRIEEDRITYLNKGQYYGLTLEHDGQRTIKSQTLKSVIMVVFREDKHLEDERKSWEFWHSRQHSYKQRVIDIDTKNSINIGPNCTEEIAYNAVAVKWNPRDSPVKVNIAVHCLSTDFSNQKGVKGLPLHVQVDTYENSTKDAFPISRGYCQIKVFCDKGAERKIRDEERRKQCRVSKTETQPGTKALRRRHEEVYHEALDKSEFYPVADLQSQPILFTPTFESDDSARPSPVNLSITDEDGSSSITSSVDHYDSAEDGISPAAKRPRTDHYTPYQTFSNILLYVREKHEVVFTAVMLRSPTLHGLLQAVEEKYNVPMSKIKHSYKRSKKGILVRMDDNIIRHYSHESTFIIELKKKDDGYELILTEIDPC